MILWLRKHDTSYKIQKLLHTNIKHKALKYANSHNQDNYHNHPLKHGQQAWKFIFLLKILDIFIFIGPACMCFFCHFPRTPEGYFHLRLIVYFVYLPEINYKGLQKHQEIKSYGKNVQQTMPLCRFQYYLSLKMDIHIWSISLLPLSLLVPCLFPCLCPPLA